MATTPYNEAYEARKQRVIIAKDLAVAEILPILSSSSLPESFCEQASLLSVEALRASYVQRRRRRGYTLAEMARLYKKQTGRRLAGSTLAKLAVFKLVRSPDSEVKRKLNLPLGRFCELAFQRNAEKLFDRHGFILEDVTSDRSSIDYLLRAQGSSEMFIAFNAKSVGIRFDQAKDVVGLDPNDCHAVESYKVAQNVKGDIPQLYVIHNERETAERLFDVWWALLSKEEQNAYSLLVTCKISKNLEDAFIAATVDQRFDQLVDALGKPIHLMSLRVISARKLYEIGQSNLERLIGGKRKADGRNIHYSLASESVSLRSFVKEHLTSSSAQRALVRNLKKPLPKPKITSAV